MASPIVIGTSLAPRDFDLQRDSVDSWRALGFDVVSFNAADELDVLRTEFPYLTFVPMERTAQAFVGRPLVFISDMIRHFIDEGLPIAGLVNADIALRGQQDLRGFLSNQARGALVFGHRQDIADEHADRGTPYELGFDFFFFDPSIYRDFDLDVRFCIGMPFWDYWLPVCSLLAGLTVKRLDSPIAFHVEHELNWDFTFFNSFGCEFYRSVAAALEANVDLAQFDRDHPEDTARHQFSLLYFQFLLETLAEDSGDETLHDQVRREVYVADLARFALTLSRRAVPGIRLSAEAAE
ncbi:MAG: hypothetical protein QNJ92_05820 [Alphaproteobacteria bacterium]|nr:hypothetical protein [Alphaproteobacteria bacterium]